MLRRLDLLVLKSQSGLGYQIQDFPQILTYLVDGFFFPVYIRLWISYATCQWICFSFFRVLFYPEWAGFAIDLVTCISPFLKCLSCVSVLIFDQMGVIFRSGSFWIFWWSLRLQDSIPCEVYCKAFFNGIPKLWDGFRFSLITMIIGLIYEELLFQHPKRHNQTLKSWVAARTFGCPQLPTNGILPPPPSPDGSHCSPLKIFKRSIVSEVLGYFQAIHSWQEFHD